MAQQLLRQAYADGIGWGDAKQQLFELVESVLEEPRKRYDELMANPAEIDAILGRGAERARDLSQPLMAELRRAVAMGGGGQSDDASDVGGVPFFAQILKDVPGKDLRGLIDEHKNRLGSAVILLISDAGGKAAVAAGVTDDLTDKVSAVDIVKAAAGELGGKGGGGRPDMAQAGGADASNAEQAVKAAQEVLGD